jgi:hypothetical protein
MYDIIEEEIKLLSELTELQQDEILPKLQFLLNEINLSEMVYSKRIRILIDILAMCKNYDSSNLIVKMVLIRWCNHDLDPDGVLGDLAANADCPDEILSFLVTKFKYSTPVTILDTHIRTRYGQGMVFSYTADRILNAYDKNNLSQQEWSILVEAINDTNKEIEELNSESSFWVKERLIDIQSNPMTQGNQDILNYIKDKVSKLGALALTEKISKLNNKKLTVKKPDWIRETGETCFSDTFEEEVQSNKDEEYYELKNMLEKYTTVKNKDSEENEDNTSDMRDEIIQNFCTLGKNKVSNEKSNDMFRRYGPENAILGFSCLGCPQGKEGPCRMFYCVCREFDDEEIDNEFLDEEIDSSAWFSGECDVCEAKIQKLQYAVRFPVDGGGWLGCYCSFGCLRKTNVRPIYESDDFRIRDIQESLNTFGIADA